MDGGQEGSSVERRLDQVVSWHEASLAGLTTTAGATSQHRSHLSNDDDSGVDAAVRRVACSTLNGDGSTGGSTCVGDEVSTVCLNPPERAMPHKIVPRTVPGSQVDDENNVERESHDVDEEDDAALASQKAIAALSALCEEAADLDNMATSSLIPAVLLFGPHPRLSSELEMEGDASLAAKLDERAVCLREADLITRMGKYFVFLQGLHNFTFRCQRLARNVVCQISACYTAPTPFLSKAHLVPVGESLAIVLRLLITIDAAISSNSDLLEAWDLYTSIIKEGSSSTLQPPINSKLEPFKRLIGQLDFSIMSSRSFLAAIEQDFGLNAPHTNMTPSPSFLVHEEIKSLVSILYERYCSGVGSDSETTEMRDLVGVYGLYALYRRILPSNSLPDAKLHKHLWTAFPQRSPVIALDGNISFTPREFMIQYAHFEVKGCDHLVAISDAAAFVTTFDGSFPAEAARCRARTVQWIAEVDSRLALSANCCNVSNDTPAADVEATGALLLKGLVIAHRSSTLAKTLLILHKALEIPLQSSLISALMSLLEALKSIEQMVRSRRRAAVVAVQQPALGLIAATIFRSFEQHREVVDEHKSMGRSPSYDQSVCMSKLGACLSTLECTLKGSSTYSTLRSFTAAIACCACTDGNVLCGVGANEEMALPLLRRLRLLGDIDDNIRKACDCSFLYFHSELMPIFLRNLYQSTTSTGRLQLTLSAFADPANSFLHCTPHLDMADDGTEGSLVTAYRSYVAGLLQEEIVQPICHEVESCLRLAIHRKRFGQILSTKPTLNATKRLLPFLEMPPLRSFGGVMELKRHVEKYLQATFYNLTTVALHDAQLYVEMSILAKEKFGLDVADYDLPLGCLEQGFDVLRIMRNIHVFVAKFNYNLNQQSFVERSPVRGSKFLNTVNISSISTSLRQHGIGIINSAVNFTYQFLIEKFHTLSHLLMDDYARSHLSREVRWFIAHRRGGGKCYSHERALAFAKEMEKLSCDVSGESLLDRLRTIISEIGNAVGFVRLVRSAGIRSASGALQFFPEPSLNNRGKSATSFGPPLFGDDTSEMCNFKCADNVDRDKKTHSSTSLSQESCMASDVLNGVRCSLGHYFEDDTDYCRVLVDAFGSVLLCAEHKHLETFYALLPALCLSWVNSTVQAKEMMYRKNRIGDAYYTDDGFALGFTFVLAILKQKEKADALNWFSALADKFASDERDLREQKVAKNSKVGAKQSSLMSSIFGVGTVEKQENLAGEDDEEVITLQAAFKQWEEKKRESEALYITMEGALVFFGGIYSVF